MKGTRLILESQPPQWFAGETLRIDLYYSFWATTAAKLLRPFEQRKEWTSRLISSILSIQKTSGKDAGSFPPGGKWGMVGGRVYSTAMAALVLLRLRTDKPLDLTVEKHRRKRPENLTEAQPAEEQEQTWIPRGIKPTEGGHKTVEELARYLCTHTVTLCFNDTSLVMTLSFLRDISNCHFILTPEIPDEEATLTVRIRDMPLGQALEAICLSLGDIDYGLYKTESGVPVVVFSTPEDIAQRNLEKPDSFVPAIDCSSMKAKLYHHPCPFGLTGEELQKTLTLQKKLREKIKIEKPIKTFGQLREFFEKSTGIPIRLSDEAARALADDTPVQSTDGEVRLSSLLHRARRAAGLYFVVSPDAVLFPSSETYVAMRWYAFNQYSLTKPALETRTVNLNVQEESLENIISFLQDLTGLNFVLTAAAREKAQDAEITMNVTDMRLDDALAEICRQAGLTYVARPNYILIKTHSE